jgi:carbamoyl-phosphate synthase small subunit
MQTAFLVLENGAVFQGKMKGPRQNVSGEVVFTTGMTGYTESLTDPSYAGQILVFTFPLIGNYGVPSSEQWESKKIHARGVIVSENVTHYSHAGALCSLSAWLEQQNVPLMHGVDTRELTKLLRSKGTMLGAITDSKAQPTFDDPNQTHIVASVSASAKTVHGKGKKRIIAVDCGMKESMMRHLLAYPVEVVRVPHDYDYSQEEFDGLFLSNGPGDPEKCIEAIATLKKTLTRKKPIFGVCLGSQLLALASGAKTLRLKFGHRGHNQPCMDLKTRKCYITSQNHGFAVDERSLSAEWEVLFKNLNDDSVEGIAHKTLPYFAVQFHPEACPGPTDTRFLFERFFACL